MAKLAYLMFVVKTYCLNSTLAGLSYIADSRFHFTERIFWFLCLLLSIFGSYHLIRQSLIDFEESSNSMVVESLQRDDRTYFPSIGVCEIGHLKEVYTGLEQTVDKLRMSSTEAYNYDIEDFLLRSVFMNLYNIGSYTSYCEPYHDCVNCAKCPDTNYSAIADAVRQSCSDLITSCIWNNKTFDCCEHFRPIKTTTGTCFLLNSIQIVDKKSKRWFPMEVGTSNIEDTLEIEFSKATSFSILNEEDIPHMLLTMLEFSQQHEGTLYEIAIRVQNVVNDVGVEDIDPHLRKCYFPNEQYGSKYKYYSYSTCVTDCLKWMQIKICNCTHFNMIYDEKDESPECGYVGLECLDNHELIFPKTNIMQPWQANGLDCDCLPSCTEHEIKLISRTYKTKPEILQNRRITRISMPSLPTQRYRRQAVRNNLDIVVSVGGIMGLFLGASILSLFEFIYFFTIRVSKNMI